jgi:hypothetical protein
MLKKDVAVGRTYVATIGGRRTVVRLEADLLATSTWREGRTWWSATNLMTNHRVTIKSAAKLQREIAADKVEAFLQIWRPRKVSECTGGFEGAMARYEARRASLEPETGEVDGVRAVLEENWAEGEN